MDIQQFDYELPPELIAQTPLEPRHASRLMLINRRTQEISHHTFSHIVDLLQSGDILIANDSRVIPARLYGRKISGGNVEILLLKRIDDRRWEALAGGKRLRPGVMVEIQAALPLTLTIKADLGDARRLIEFNTPIEPLLSDLGHVPLPPYIHTTLDDPERYQTIFSRVDGSAAAPTAGLHFSPEILLALRHKGVSLDYVTLHIGLDTFKPVTVEQIEAHAIHCEAAQLTAETARRINEAKLAGGRLVAVGTTAIRALETAALRSAGYGGSLREISALPPPFKGEEGQGCPWRPLIAIEEETDLYIYPGYTFRAVDAMLTNFHLPKSTLLMLVSAFAGRELIRRAYDIAIAEKYRFYSFGDALLIL